MWGGGGGGGQQEVGALALSIDLGATPSLAPVLVNSVLTPSTVVAGLSANLDCSECTLHFAARIAAEGMAQTEWKAAPTSGWVPPLLNRPLCLATQDYRYSMRIHIDGAYANQALHFC